MHLLVGTDGQQKMSKSLGNYIAVNDTPEDMYGKVMSIPDDLLMDYFELLTDVSDKELAEFKQQFSTQSVNPMILKKRLAKEIVGQFHGADAAGDAESHFEKVVQKKEVPSETIEVPIRELRLLASAQQTEEEIVDALLMESIGDEGSKWFSFSLSLLLVQKNVVKSRSEAKRLIDQRAIEVVHVDGSRTIVYDDRPLIRVGDVIKVGKRRWVKIVNTDTKQ
jgi:tyrosyl-tRNA synthetase